MYELVADGTLEPRRRRVRRVQGGLGRRANAAPPELFGMPFNVVEEPNRYGIPTFYELHAWAWKDNPTGAHEDWNPTVVCPVHRRPHPLTLDAIWVPIVTRIVRNDTQNASRTRYGAAMQIECVADIVRAHSATEARRRVAVDLGDRTVSWGELYERARTGRPADCAPRVSAPQDRVAFLDKNGIEHLQGSSTGPVAWRRPYSSTSTGVLAAPDIAYIVNDAQAKLVIVGEGLSAGVRRHGAMASSTTPLHPRHQQAAPPTPS